MSKHFKPRRYLFHLRDGVVAGTSAPLAILTKQLELLLSRDDVREVTFEEWLPVAWAESDYVDPYPPGMTETEYWQMFT